jgi:hypothetical protein
MENIDFKFLKGSMFWEEYWQTMRNLGFTQKDIDDFKNGKSRHRATFVFTKIKMKRKKNN